MNINSRRKSSTPETEAQLTRVTRLLRHAKHSIHTADGRSPTNLELEESTGVAEGTLKYWFNNKGYPTAEFLLQLLERIPEKQEHDMLGSARRLCPSLEDSRLECDQTIISSLRTIVRKPHGLVFIQGGNGESRTFLLTALGNAFLGLTARPHRIVGLDVHEPDWFVPLPGVRYLHNLFEPAKLLQAAKDNWPEVNARGLQLVVLNEIGVLMGNFSKQFKALTARCPVIVAEAAQLKPAVLKRTSHGPVHIITISKHPENPKGIAATVEAV